MLKDRVLINRLEEESRSSVIEVVEFEKRVSQYAIVLSLGPETYDMKLGDVVITKKYCGSPVEVDLPTGRATCYVVQQDDILAVVDSW
jgi:co-chaperonin GroES (HSP10)